MPKFSKQSTDRLATCDQRLQDLFNEVIKHFDCVILEGHRGKELQDKYFAEKKSKTPWPKSKHNGQPSRAVDAVPYPVKWGAAGTPDQRRKDIARFYLFAGFVKGVAANMGIKIRWGGDWDGDHDFNDQTFDDLPHFEVVG